MSQLSMPSLNNHALYQVATKALLYKDGKILVLITPDGYVDFPGGRVDESERNHHMNGSRRRKWSPTSTHSYLKTKEHN